MIAKYWAKAISAVALFAAASLGFATWILMATDIPEPEDHYGVMAAAFVAGGIGLVFFLVAMRQEEGGRLRDMFTKYIF
ncbi:MAG: hypothetical protein WCX71_03915 [Candidatus Buchananbacteria bacterium]